VDRLAGQNDLTKGTSVQPNQNANKADELTYISINIVHLHKQNLKHHQKVAVLNLVPREVKRQILSILFAAILLTLGGKACTVTLNGVIIK
jgi:hypothetical protein